MTPEEQAARVVAAFHLNGCREVEREALTDRIAAAIREAIEADRAARQCPDVDLAAIREAAASVPPGPWRWTHDYVMGGQNHWCLENDEYGADGRTIDIWSITETIQSHTTLTKDGAEVAICDTPVMTFLAKSWERIDALLSLLDFYAALLSDLQQDSDAYQRGLEIGRREERARAVRWARHHEARMRWDEIASRSLADEHWTLVYRGGASTAGQIANDIAQEGAPS